MLIGGSKLIGLCESGLVQSLSADFQILYITHRARKLELNSFIASTAISSVTLL